MLILTRRTEEGVTLFCPGDREIYLDVLGHSRVPRECTVDVYGDITGIAIGGQHLDIGTAHQSSPVPEALAMRVTLTEYAPMTITPRADGAGLIRVFVCQRRSGSGAAIGFETSRDVAIWRNELLDEPREATA